MKDYYDILGVPRDASQDDVKRAYRILAQQFHPDKENGSEKRFKEVNEAYRVLSGDVSKAEYDTHYDNGLPKEEAPRQTAAAPQKSKGFKWNWTGWVLGIVVFFVVRALTTHVLTPTTNADASLPNPTPPLSTSFEPTLGSSGSDTQPTPQTNSQPQGQLSHEQMIANINAMEQQGAKPQEIQEYLDSLKSGSDTNTSAASTQFPTGKCVTESGVQICDLSYNVTSTTANTRTVSMQGNEIVCRDISNELSTDVHATTAGISMDPTFCATDYGSVYIDPSISVGKHYSGIITSTSGDYIVPANYSPCIWTYNGGSGDIPYIQVGGDVGPATSFYNVHAFCQNGANEVDIFTASS